VVSLALVMSMTTVAGLAMVGAGHLLMAQNLQTSVDRAALAAGDVLVGVSAGEPCLVAREILSQNGFTVRSCELTTTSARVVAGANQWGFWVTRRAHAGIANSGQK
jgi:hypothetical protein